MDKVQTFNSVWDAIEDSPEEAENMKLRSTLMLVLKQFIKHNCATQKEAAKVLGLTTNRVSYLTTGKVEKFKLDTLVLLASRAGYHVTMDVTKGQAA